MRADLRESRGFGAAELHGDGLLKRIERHQPRAVAMNDRAGREHFRVKARAAR